MKYYEFFAAEAVVKEFDAMEQKITEHLSGSDKVNFDEVVRGFKMMREDIENKGVEYAKARLSDEFGDNIDYGESIFTSVDFGTYLALTVMEMMEWKFRLQSKGDIKMYINMCMLDYKSAKDVIQSLGVMRIERKIVRELGDGLEGRGYATDDGVYTPSFWGDVWAVMEYYFGSDFFLEGVKE